MTAARRRPIALVNHGAGQSYRGDPRAADHSAYSGGGNRDRVRLFIEPGWYAAAKTVAAAPDARVAVVGSPFLDPWHRGARPSGDGETVAVTFHWNAKLCPETQWAWPWWKDAVAALAASGRYRLLGHAHPRAWPRLAPWWKSIGVEAAADWANVLDRAALLAVDNSSAGPEFASTGRPIVWLNAPHYRRHVNHGGRFWEWTAGQVTADQPDELGSAIDAGLADSPQAQAARSAMVRSVFETRSGVAARLAAQAVLDTAAVVHSRP